jgi:hypothetical protein
MAGMVAVVASESQVFDGVGSAIALGNQMFDGHLFAGEVLAAIATVGAILGDESFPFVVLFPGCHVGHIHGSCFRLSAISTMGQNPGNQVRASV